MAVVKSSAQIGAAVPSYGVSLPEDADVTPAVEFSWREPTRPLERLSAVRLGRHRDEQ